MRALVVFESAFGNTEKIARAINEGLTSVVPTRAVEVGGAALELEGDVDLLVVGGPTHAFGMSRPGTRQQAAKQAEHGVVSNGIGIREWLESVLGPAPRLAAAFDTRFKKPRLITGSAARSAEKRLRELGCRMAAPAESFFVSGTSGPLLDGEVERARRWGERLGSLVDEAVSRS
jgi:hypothetical protein